MVAFWSMLAENEIVKLHQTTQIVLVWYDFDFILKINWTKPNHMIFLSYDSYDF